MAEYIYFKFWQISMLLSQLQKVSTKDLGEGHPLKRGQILISKHNVLY